MKVVTGGCRLVNTLQLLIIVTYISFVDALMTAAQITYSVRAKKNVPGTAVPSERDGPPKRDTCVTSVFRFQSLPHCKVAPCCNKSLNLEFQRLK